MIGYINLVVTFNENFVMKKAILLFTISFYWITSSFGQVISVANEKENIVTVGLDNPLSIAVENSFAKSIVVKTDNGTISGQNGEYLFRPVKVGRATITLFKKVNGKLKEVGKKDFRAKLLWDPVFKIGSSKDSISRKELQAQRFVRAELEGSDFDLMFGIESFIVCVISKDTCKYIEMINKGNEISKEISGLFQRLNIYDTIIFKEIICVGPGGKRKISPKLITVIE